MALAAPARHAAPAAAVVPDPGPRLPLAVVIVAGVVLAVNVVVMLAGGIMTGVSIDEPLHVYRLQEWFDTGWYLPYFQMTGDQPAAGVNGLYVYGPVSALLAHAVSVVSGAEPLGTVEATAQAYASRHVAIGLMSVVCLAAAASIVRLLTRSWRWALLAAAALSALPVWTGHSMFNIKDAPVAAGYTVMTLGVVALSRPGLARSSRLRALAIGALASGAVLAVGTRPGLWVAALVTLVAVLAVGWWADDRCVGRAAAVSRLLVRGRLALLGLAAAYVVLLLVYPQLFAHPDRLLAAVTGSSEYPWASTILTAGTELPMPPPRWYLPAWFGAQTPLVLLALAVPGLLAPLWLLVRGGRRPDAAAELSRAVGMGAVSLQALLLPVGGVVLSSVLYDGTRQLLFVQPALAIAAVMAAWLAVRALPGRRIVQGAGFAVLCVGLVVPTATHIRLFPYDYTWFNAAAASQGIDGRWMTEYWRTSARALVPYLPPGEPVSCTTWTADGGLLDCDVIPQAAPYAATRGTQIEDEPLGPMDYYLLGFNRGGSALPRECRALHVESRPLFGQDLPMSWVARCSIPVLDLPASGVRTADGAGRGYFIRGWYPPAGDPVWTTGTTGMVAFRVPAGWSGRDLRVTLVAAPYGPADEPSHLDVRVNGAPTQRFVYGAPVPRELSLTVPAAAADAYGDGLVVVQVASPAAFVPAAIGDNASPWPLGLQLSRVDVRPAP